MAKLVEQDGTITGMGGIAQVRNAFVNAGRGKLVCTEGRLDYDHESAANAQVLRFVGKFAETGKPFDVASGPLPAGANLSEAAVALARSLIEA